MCKGDAVEGVPPIVRGATALPFGREPRLVPGIDGDLQQAMPPLLLRHGRALQLGIARTSAIYLAERRAP